jgi:phage terminase large subunit GpA-like protein
MAFLSLEHMVLASAQAVRPPERLSVSEAAERYHIVKNPGSHSGPFDFDKTPYLREPNDLLTSLDFRAVVLVAPARTGKSATFINWLCHTAICDPSDMMLVHMAQHTARTWSQGDLSKAIRHSDELKKRIAPGKANDNVYDKTFLSGMRLEVTWPTIKNLSGKTYRYVGIMDNDRVKPQIVEQEAFLFDAARKRTGTYKRYGMTYAETSPGFPITDPKWSQPAAEPHQAPPCDGLLSVYNRGDRRRWYWQCPWCGDWFQPRFNLMRWPNSTDFMESAEQAYIACPHCFEVNKDPIIHSMMGELNNAGKWLIEGQRFDGDQIVGRPRRSQIASFWMFGPAAGLATDWKELVLNYLQATEEFKNTGNDGNLMTTITVDQGEAYLPPALEGGLLPELLKSRAEEWGGRDEHGTPYVPDGVRFLMAMIDVQAGTRPNFVVHIFGVGVGFDIWHIDMFKIERSDRINLETGERHLIDPAAYPEDWDVLIGQVMERTWPLNDGSGRRMALKMTACDSGGRDGVTRNAYEFYHRLREAGKEKRFHLLAGRPSQTDLSTLRLSHIENWTGTKRLAGAVGAIPLWLVNSNIVKDAADSKLRRTEPGGMIHFPNWAPDWLYSQLTNEVRLPKGWDNPNKKRNEAWDLLSYCIAFCDHTDIRMRFINWEAPPGWAAPWDRNDMVVASSEAALPFQEKTARPKKSLADLARDMA